ARPVTVTASGKVQAVEDTRNDRSGGRSVPPGMTPSKGVSLLETPLTQAGAFMGTPAYMAPEQYKLETVDARTDEFAFCVALYEGLFGARPWSKRELMELRSEVLAGEIPDPPRDTQTPAWVRKGVWRGVKVEPAKRYP